MSPLLFVLVTEPFNRQLDTILGWRARCAFADDLALVGTKGRQAWPQLTKLFSAFAKMSGMFLNMLKCVVIPLWTSRINEALAHLQASPQNGGR